MTNPSPNKLLVEGKDDLYAIAELMSAHVPWGDPPAERPVEIINCEGVEKLLAPHRIPLELKSAGTQALGIVVDADDDFEGRWTRIRECCKEAFPKIPAALPPEGLVVDNARGQRLGVWIMPDNSSHGMLETFLVHLVPHGQDKTWAYAQHAAKEATKRGAAYVPKHRDKAMIHTWLAWQEPPGRPFGTALTAKILDPKSNHASAFVQWFRTLYRL